MIRFQDIAEGKASSELLPSAEYQNIRSQEHLSKEDATEFWNSIFTVAPEAQGTYTIDEDSLLPEIFNRYEDEFVFDFELDDEIQSALEPFVPSIWEKLSDEERLAATCELADAIGKKLGLDENPTVRFYSAQDSAYGAYLPSEDTIEINQNTLFDGMEIVDTIAHELRHAYQYQRAMCGETLQDKLYRLNFENYISPVPLADGKYLFFTDYQNQLVEADARAFANIFTSKGATQ